jgi:hypothetical protein
VIKLYWLTNDKGGTAWCTREQAERTLDACRAYRALLASSPRDRAVLRMEMETTT